MGRKPAKNGRQKDGSLSEAEAFQRARKNARADRAEWDVMSAGMMARHRLYGLPYPTSATVRKDRPVRPHALDQNAGSFVGRLFMQREITREQLDAAQAYAELCAQVDEIHGGPRPSGAVNLNSTRGSANYAEDEARTLRILARYKAARRAVQEKQNECRGFANLFGALSVCVLDDKPVTTLIGDLRLATSALARHWRLVDGRAQALDRPAKIRINVTT